MSLQPSSPRAKGRIPWLPSRTTLTVLRGETMTSLKHKLQSNMETHPELGRLEDCQDFEASLNNIINPFPKTNNPLPKQAIVAVIGTKKQGFNWSKINGCQ